MDGRSAFEKQYGRKLNTLNSTMIEKCIRQKEPQIAIEPEHFSEEADSTIRVRERVRRTKQKGSFRKFKGKVLHKSENTLTVLPNSGKEVTISKMLLTRSVHNAAKQQATIGQKTKKEKSKL